MKMNMIELDDGASMILLVIVAMICGTILLSVAMCTGYLEKPECEATEAKDR